MAPRSKIITYVVIAVAVVWLGGCLVRREAPVYAKWRLKRQVQKLEPWPASASWCP